MRLLKVVNLGKEKAEKEKEKVSKAQALSLLVTFATLHYIGRISVL